MVIKEITVHELKQKMDEKLDFQLIDVREPKEYEFVNIEGELIPLSKLADHVDKIDKKKPVVVMCRSGVRSADAIGWLQTNFQLDNLFNLKGGILAWADHIDPSKPKY